MAHSLELFVIGVLNLKNKLNILCITPINHLINTKNILKNNHTLIYKPKLNKKETLTIFKFLIHNLILHDNITRDTKIMISKEIPK